MKTVKCPHDLCSVTYPDKCEEHACTLCDNTGEVPTALAVEYALLDLNAIYNWDVWLSTVDALLGLDSTRSWSTWDRWEKSIEELRARHKHEDS